MSFLHDPRRLLRASSRLLLAGVLLFAAGVAVAYGPAEGPGLGTAIAAHVVIVVGPTLFKLGYVLRLTAQEQLQKQARPPPGGVSG